MGFADFAPAIEAAGAIGSNVIGGLFSANQAKKNRAFQERMYYQQLEDNRRILEDARAYALPSAEIQRLKDAHINPLLYYGQGGAMSQITPAQGASAPHGSQAQANFQNPFAGFTQNMKAMEMMQAEIDLLRSQKVKLDEEATKTRSETDWQNLENKFQKDTYSIRILLQHGEYDKVKAITSDYWDQIFQRGFMNATQAASIALENNFLVKRFHLDEWAIGEQIAQGWQNISIGKMNANAALKQAAAAWQNALTNKYITKWQVGAIAQDIWYKSLEQPYRLTNMSLQNTLNRYGIKGASLDNIKKSIDTRQKLVFGTDNIPSWMVPFFGAGNIAAGN